MSKFEDEYSPPFCVLMSRMCDKECPYFDDCPIENYDVAQGEFIKRVIDIAQGEDEPKSH